MGKAGVGVGSTSIGPVDIPTSVDADPNFDKMLRGSAHLGADVIWGFTRLVSTICVDTLSWAFKVNLFDGRGGLIGIASKAARDLYRNVSAPLLPVIALLAGGWFLYCMWRGRLGRSMAGIAGSVLLFAVTMWILTSPQETIGVASKAATDLSRAAISAPAPNRDHGDEAFRMLIVRPWQMLEFGGLKRCFDKNGKPGGSHCVDTWDRFGKRVAYFGPSNSKRRIEELTTVSKGDGDRKKPPCEDSGARTYPCENPEAGGDEDANWQPVPARVGSSAYQPRKDERGAADMASGQAAVERALFASAILAFSVPQWLLIGGVGLLLLLIQVVMVAWFMAAPIAALASLWPGSGHRWLLGWLRGLFGLAFGKLFISFGLGVVMVTLSAMQQALPSGVGWILAFLLSAALCGLIVVFLPAMVKGVAKRSAVPPPPAPPAPIQNFAQNQTQNLRNRFSSKGGDATQAASANGAGDDGSLRTATQAIVAKANPEAAAAGAAAQTAGTGDGRPPGSKAPDARPGAPAPPKTPGGPQVPSDVRAPRDGQPVAPAAAAAPLKGAVPAPPDAAAAERGEAAKREALKPLEPGEKAPVAGRAPLSQDLAAARSQPAGPQPPAPQLRPASPVRNEPHAPSAKLSEDVERMRRAESARRPLPEPGK